MSETSERRNIEASKRWYVRMPNALACRGGQQRYALSENIARIRWTTAQRARRVSLRMCNVGVPRELSAAILDRIHRIGVPPLVQRG